MSKRVQPIGNPKAKIAVVGDFPRQKDEEKGVVFNSNGGRELMRMLNDAGGSVAEYYYTTVFKTRPYRDDIKYFCAKKSEVGGKSYTLPPIASGKYVKPEYLFELQNLKEELEEVKPNIVIALGNVGTWALLASTKISSLRGTVAESTLIPGLKVLPTYHPYMIFKQWHNRPIVIMDMMKALREADTPEIVRPKREIWIRPTLQDLWDFYERYLESCTDMTFDIETARGQITCIGFAPNKNVALVIPFTSKETANYSYWKTPDEEIEAWKFVEMLCRSAINKIGQNGLYDIQYLIRVNGIPVYNYKHDTMLMAHALYSELPKSLGFLGSVYTNEASWKGMHKHKTKEKDMVKKDD